MAEAHHHAFFAERGQHPFPCARRLADFQQQMHHRFICAAVQWAFQRTDSANDRAVNIRLTRCDHARGECGSIESMLRVKNQRNVKSLHDFQRGHFAEDHVKEIFGETDVLARRDEFLTFAGTIERRDHRGNLREHGDGAFQICRRVGFVHLCIFRAKKTHRRPQHVHRMRCARGFLDDRKQIIADIALAAFGFLEFRELRGVR